MEKKTIASLYVRNPDPDFYEMRLWYEKETLSPIFCYFTKPLMLSVHKLFSTTKAKKKKLLELKKKENHHFTPFFLTLQSCISTIFSNQKKKASANDKWARLSYYQKPTKDPPKRALKKLENTFHFSKYY